MIAGMNDYTLKRHTRSKHIRVRVANSGEVVVTAPKRVSKREIDSFVMQSEDWIARQQQKVRLRKQANPTLDWEENLVSYLGKLYEMRFDPEGEEKIALGRKYIHICPVTGLERHVKKTLLSWLKLEGSRYITKRTTEVAKAMDVPYGKIRFGQQKSRWGSCSSNGTLSFNWRLVHFKPEIIDYVIVHELAHVKHANHSRDFWALVRRHDKDYKRKRVFLKKQVIVIERV